jgi:hypothetical protein
MEELKALLDFSESNPTEFDELMQTLAKESEEEEECSEYASFSNIEYIPKKEIVAGYMAYYGYRKCRAKSPNGGDSELIQIALYDLINIFTSEAIKDERERDRVMQAISFKLKP